VVKEELKQRYEGRPYGTLQDNLFKNTFKGTQYEWTPIGVAQDINNASKEEFIDFHSRFYLPNNACLVVGGDLDVAQTKKWIEQYFGGISAGSEPVRVKVTIPPQSEPRRVAVQEDVTPLPGYVESYITVDSRHPDAYALDFLGTALSTGRSSRLYQRLVDKDQLAITAGSFPMSLDQAGMFAFFAIANQGVAIKKLEDAISEELTTVQKDGITDEEFQKLRNMKESEFVQGLTSLDGKLRALAYYALFHQRTAMINEEYQKYMAVTRDDVKRVANQYLRPERKNVLEYVVADKTK
jgi:predicted Zn-dependent peptidase